MIFIQAKRQRALPKLDHLIGLSWNHGLGCFDIGNKNTKKKVKICQQMAHENYKPTTASQKVCIGRILCNKARLLLSAIYEVT